MPRHSAGIVLYRHISDTVEILLVHPGGPFWRGKDMHAWSFPKGEFDPDKEDAEDAARREFTEETSHVITSPLSALPPFRSSNKVIHAFLAEGGFDITSLKSNMFEIEWPPRSGQKQSFPEVDAAQWFELEATQEKLHKGLIPVVERIRERVCL
jgi:predicted NUDIX family NTP pyrophosphohydrolase